VPGEPLAPRRGIPSGRGPRTTCWRQGSGACRLTLHLPFPLRNRGRSAVSPAPRREAAPFRRLTPFRRNGAGHPPAATPNVRDPFRSWGGSRRNTHPRSPALNSVIEGSGILTRGWRLRPWAPFSLSSDFLFLLPFICLPGELRAFALLGAPLLPLPSGAPLLPRHPEATGGRQFPPLPIREAERWSSLPIAPPGEAPVGPGEVQRRHPPHPGGHDAAVPRRLSSAPPIPLLAPPGFRPGDWETAAADPGGPVSHEAGRLTDLDRDMLDLRTYINRYGHFC
jgi:hypothetical protein